MNDPIPLPGGYFSSQAEKQTLYIPADVLNALREWEKDYCNRLIQIHSTILNIRDVISWCQKSDGKSFFFGPAVKAGMLALLKKTSDAMTPYPAAGEMLNTSVLIPPQIAYKIMKIDPEKSFSKCLLIAVNVAINSPKIVKKADFLANFLTQDKRAKIAIKAATNQYQIIYLPQVNELKKLL